MENKQLKQTKFDSMVTNRTMQLIKVVIPYIDNNIGSMIGMFIKFQELQNALRLKNNHSVAAMNSDSHSDLTNMFEDIKDILDEEQAGTIDMILSMMQMMNMDDDTKGAFMGNYMNMFGGDMFGSDMFGGDMFGGGMFGGDMFGGDMPGNNMSGNDESKGDISDDNVDHKDVDDTDISDSDTPDNEDSLNEDMSHTKPYKFYTD